MSVVLCFMFVLLWLFLIRYRRCSTDYYTTVTHFIA